MANQIMVLKSAWDLVCSQGRGACSEAFEKATNAKDDFSLGSNYQLTDN